MDDEKQCMSDSLGFPAGQATWVIQLGSFTSQYIWQNQAEWPAIHGEAQCREPHKL